MSQQGVSVFMKRLFTSNKTIIIINVLIALLPTAALFSGLQTQMQLMLMFIIVSFPFYWFMMGYLVVKILRTSGVPLNTITLWGASLLNIFFCYRGFDALIGLEPFIR